MSELKLIVMKQSEFEQIMNALNQIVSQPPSNMEDSKDRLNQQEAADFLNITEATLISWKKRKLVPYEQLEGTRKVSFSKTQLRQIRQQNSKLLQPVRK
jgi:hypothetical protein